MIKGLYEAHLPVKNMEDSIEFYQNIGLECAAKGERVSFFWIEKGKSWLGLWECEQVHLPYHPSIRHIAFRIEMEDLKRVQRWLQEKGIKVRKDFGIEANQQPLILKNGSNSHAAIYFHDPDGNSIELITPLVIDDKDIFNENIIAAWMEERINEVETELDRWFKEKSTGLSRN